MKTEEEIKKENLKRDLMAEENHFRTQAINLELNEKVQEAEDIKDDLSKK